MKEKRLDRTLYALCKNGFMAHGFTTRGDFYGDFFEDIKEARTIAVGGSVTIRELGLIEKLKAQGKEVIHHWVPGLTEEEDEPIRRKEMAADSFLTSTNALTESGFLINIDGIGNRVAAMIFGPKKVFVVVGVNKIVKDAEEGINRVKNIAAPLNAQRVKANVPCCDRKVRGMRFTKKNLPGYNHP